MRILVHAWVGADRQLIPAVQKLEEARSREQLLQPADVRIIVAASLSDAVLWRTITDLRGGTAPAPLVLVTSHEPANLLHLRHIIVDEVLSLDSPAAEWQQAITSTAEERDRVELAAAIRTADHLPELLRIGLLRLAMARPPFRTVMALARSLGCSRSTLRYHFRSTGCAGRFEDLVDWFVLQHYGWRRSASAAGAGAPAIATLVAMKRRLIVATSADPAVRPAAGSLPLLHCLLHHAVRQP